MRKFVLYTDGGARGNPGPAGAGAYLEDVLTGKTYEYSKFLGVQTNNVAEYEAILLGLEGLLALVPEEERDEIEVSVKMDSELAVRQLNGVYRVKDATLKQYVSKIRETCDRSFPRITFTHIRREKNIEADRLSNVAMDRGR